MKPESFNAIHTDINCVYIWLSSVLCKGGIAVLIPISIQHGILGQNRYRKETGGKRNKAFRKQTQLPEKYGKKNLAHWGNSI